MIVRSDPKAREVSKNLVFYSTPKAFSESTVFANSNGPGLVFGLSFCKLQLTPYGLEIPLKDLVQKSLHFWVLS